MGNQDPSAHRPAAQATVAVLTLGTLIAVTMFVVAFAIRLLGQETLSDQVGTVAVIALLATPAVALITTALEMRADQRTAAGLALLVLGILVSAAALAVITSS